MPDPNKGQKWLADEMRQFVNETAMQLKPSNDTMEAVRLFRNEIPDFFDSLLSTIESEIDGKKNLNIRRSKNGNPLTLDDSERVATNHGIDTALQVLRSYRV